MGLRVLPLSPFPFRAFRLLGPRGKSCSPLSLRGQGRPLVAPTSRQGPEAGLPTSAVPCSASRLPGTQKCGWLLFYVPIMILTLTERQ